jgi:hypothetical protein
MRTRGLALGLLALVLGAGCEERRDLASGDLFDYKGFDEQGRAVIEGTLLFEVVGDHVAGHWQLSSLVPESQVGPQIGQGSFDGSFVSDTDRSTVVLNLNPRQVDYNVFLNGTVEGRDFEGRWSLTTLVGETHFGRFEAERHD